MTRKTARNLARTQPTLGRCNDPQRKYSEVIRDGVTLVDLY